MAAAPSLSAQPQITTQTNTLAESSFPTWEFVSRVSNLQQLSGLAFAATLAILAARNSRRVWAGRNESEIGVNILMPAGERLSSEPGAGISVAAFGPQAKLLRKLSAVATNEISHLALPHHSIVYDKLAGLTFPQKRENIFDPILNSDEYYDSRILLGVSEKTVGNKTKLRVLGLHRAQVVSLLADPLGAIARHKERHDLEMIVTALELLTLVSYTEPKMITNALADVSRIHPRVSEGTLYDPAELLENARRLGPILLLNSQQISENLLVSMNPAWGLPRAADWEVEHVYEGIEESLSRYRDVANAKNRRGHDIRPAFGYEARWFEKRTFEGTIGDSRRVKFPNLADKINMPDFKVPDEWSYLGRNATYEEFYRIARHFVSPSARDEVRKLEEQKKVLSTNLLAPRQLAVDEVELEQHLNSTTAIRALDVQALHLLCNALDKKQFVDWLFTPHPGVHGDLPAHVIGAGNNYGRALPRNIL